MLFTITTTAHQADDLSFLLHKHPARVQVFGLKFGKVHVFYPEVSETRCTAAMLLEVDPVALVRRHGSGSGGTLGAYVNDRPYVASSFLSVAISQVFGTALAGHCKDLPDRVDEVMPFEVNITVLPCRGGETMLRRLFEPLGYQVEATPHALDERFPQWGTSRYFTVTLKATCSLQALLSHLYVLVPVLDDDKHYYVGEDEVEKLLRRGERWLPSHPERDLITERYLKYQRSLVREALARLQEDAVAPDATAERDAAAEAALEAPVQLNVLRLEAVLEALKHCGARRVLDLGCGEGKLLVMLMKDPYFERLVGVDVSAQALEIAARRLHLDRHPKRRERVSLLHGALTYRDDRLNGYDAAVLVEVIEHLDAPRLRALERVVFAHARPGCVIVTTPNREYNVRFEFLPAGNFRHPDHRFEWGRSEFRTWAEHVAAQFGYTVKFVPIGEADEALGPPTQMAVFEQLHD
jgi:3' terminal RNA ribose 2'-O-methyltransferase Hen1